MRDNRRQLPSKIDSLYWKKYQICKIKVIGKTWRNTCNFGGESTLSSVTHFSSSLARLKRSPPLLSKAVVTTIKTHFHHVIGERYPNASLELIERKIKVFCYDYYDSFERFEDEALHSREQFYSRLGNAECTLEDYLHARRVWTAYSCKKLSCYMKLYLLTDICYSPMCSKPFVRIRWTNTSWTQRTICMRRS